jgi:hypothetical protein
MTTPERDLEAAILRLIPARVRAGGFPTATFIVCEKIDRDELGRATLALREVHDHDGLLAHAAHVADRPGAPDGAFEELARTMQLELGLIGLVDDLGDDVYFYDDPIAFVFAADHAEIEYVEDWDDDDRHGEAASPPGEDVAPLVSAVLHARARLDEQEARGVEAFLAWLPDAIWDAGFPTATRVTITLDASDFPPRLDVLELLDQNGRELDVERIESIHDMVREAPGLLALVRHPVTFELTDQGAVRLGRP